MGRRRGWAGPALPFSAAPVSAVQCACVALSAAPGTQPREQGQMWSLVGGGQVARGSPRSRRTLVALTSQAGELLSIQLDLTSGPQT